MRVRRRWWMYFGLLALALGVAGVWLNRRGGWRPLEVVVAEQDPRCYFAPIWEELTVPRALRWDAVMGSERGALVYNAQPFWEMNARRGGRHLGDDLNGIGGMNSDLGDPVYAAADGQVVFAGESSPGWGNIVILAHRRVDGTHVQSMSAHLDRIDVKRGALVARGERIGSVGTANGLYLAHLHFEVRRGRGVEIGGGYGMATLNYLDPAKCLTEWRGAREDDLSLSPLGIVLNRRE